MKRFATVKDCMWVAAMAFPCALLAGGPRGSDAIAGDGGDPCPTTVFDFDDETTGAEPSGMLVDYRDWTTPVPRAYAASQPSPWGLEIDDTVYEGSSGKSLRFFDEDPSGSTNVYLSFDPLTVADVSFSLRAEATEGEPLNTYLRGEGLGEGMGIVFWGGRFHLRTTTSSDDDIDIGPYEALRWYRFRQVIDTVANTLVTYIDDVLVDGPRVVTDMGDPEDVSLLLLATKGSQTGTAWIDSIRIGTECPDTTPPTISVAGLPSELWPPDHRMVAIDPTVTVADDEDDAPTLTLSVVSSEADDGLGDGDTADDVDVHSATSLDLRAERSGKGDGRTYTLTWTATDAAGNSATHVATVTVPKSQSKK